PRAAAALDGVEDAASGGLVPVAEAPDAVGPLVVEAFEGADLLQQAEAHAGADGVLVGGLGEHLGVVAEDLPPRAVGAALCGAEEAAEARLVGGVLLDEPLAEGAVLRRVEQHGLGEGAVAAGAAG